MTLSAQGEVIDTEINRIQVMMEGAKSRGREPSKKTL